MRKSGTEDDTNPYLGLLLLLTYGLVILLKTIGVLQWTWWVVLLPIWIVIILVAGIVALSYAEEWRKNRLKKRDAVKEDMEKEERE